MLRFAVQDWSAWAPGRETPASWRVWAGRSDSGDCRDDAAVAPLPMMLRRRLTAAGQRLFQAAAACLPANVLPRYVLATRHGELARTVNILRAATADELPSPTDFSLSVHHSLIGLLSIHAANRRGHTAISAGGDSFGFGLMEAGAAVAENPDEPVLLLFSDEVLPPEYADFCEPHEATEPMALALLLGAPDGRGETVEFAATGRTENSAPVSSPARDFLQFFLSGAAETVSEGVAMTWRWRRAIG